MRLKKGGSDCPTCGNHYAPSICRCAVNHEPVDCVPREVEYVRADTYRGVVDLLRDARNLLHEDGTENGVDRRFIDGFEKLEAALALLEGAQ